MPAPPPSELSLGGRAAANYRWALEPDRSAATAPGRAKFMAKFEEQVDPEHKLPPAERARRAESMRKSYFAKLARRSAQARRKAKEFAAEADQAEADLSALDGGPDAA